MEEQHEVHQLIKDDIHFETTLDAKMAVFNEVAKSANNSNENSAVCVSDDDDKPPKSSIGDEGPSEGDRRPAAIRANESKGSQ